MQENKKLLNTGAWALSNLCRGKPLPQKELVKDAIPIFCYLVQTQQDDQEILIDSLWGLAHLSEAIENEQTLLPMGIIPMVLRFLG